jgi:hypothetical protein
MNSSTLQREALRYYLHNASDVFRFQLAGELSMDSAQDLELTWRTASPLIGARPVIIDLSDLTGIDQSGQELLNQWNARGARLGVVSHRARERLQSTIDLPVAILRKRTPASAWRPLRSIRRWVLALLSTQMP